VDLYLRDGDVAAESRRRSGSGPGAVGDELMTGQSIAAVDPVFLGYLLAFGGAAVACFASAGRARAIADPDTRRGLVGLLLASGGWATAHVAFLVAPTPRLKTAAYLVGLVVGFAAVGPWLYFCSAYTGRALHRNRPVRRSALAVFVAVVAVKLTNPLHRLYFTTELVADPFPHLAVQNGLLHWLVVGLSYALAAVGYFMLLELFVQVSYETGPFAVLAAITGLPIALDVIGLASPALVDITYEPLGVAVFAVGTLYVYVDRFQAVQLAGERDEPSIVLDREGRIRDYNDGARALFDRLRGADAVGEPLGTAVPELADAVRGDNSILELERKGTDRYYRLTENSFGADRTRLGRLLALTDITHREQYRLELERQNARLEQFAEVVSHDLRNPLNVAEGRLALAREDRDSEHLKDAARALSRMDSLVEELLTLARQGQPIEEPEPVTLGAVAGRCWQFVETGAADLAVESDVAFLADRDRLQQLLENLFRNAIEHGSGTATVRVGDLDGEDGFYVADDGEGIPPEKRRRVLESGYSTADEGTGFGLAIVAEIADAHGWTIRVTESRSGGARFEFGEVDVEPRAVEAAS
jgi:signal transduction histidine kinase